MFSPFTLGSYNLWALLIALLFAQLFYCNLKSVQLEWIEGSGRELFIQSTWHFLTVFLFTYLIYLKVCWKVFLSLWFSRLFKIAMDTRAFCCSCSILPETSLTRYCFGNSFTTSQSLLNAHLLHKAFLKDPI